MSSLDNNNELDLAPLELRAEQLVAAVMKAGADSADAIVASSRSTGVEIREGKVEETDSSENDAFTLRAFVGKRVASVSANRGGDVNALADRVVSMARVSPEDPNSGLADSACLAKSFPALDMLDDTALSIDELRERALKVEQAALAVKGVSKSSGASFGAGLGGTVLATSDGFLGSYSASRFSLSVSAVAGAKEKMERDYDFDSQRHLSDLRDASDIGLEAGQRAVRRLNPRRVPTQSTTVLFEPRMARSLVGHIVGALNGASIARKTSFLRDDMGKQVFDDGIDVHVESFA